MPKYCGKGTNFHGKKGRSGDKPDSVKFRAMIDAGLASHIMNEELVKIEQMKVRPHVKLKDFVMPIALKGMVEKTENKTIVNINYDDEQIRRVASEILRDGSEEKL